MRGSNSNGNCEATEWERRPGGMLVQKRDEVDSEVPLIKIKVYHDSNQHDVTVPAQSTFGELKRVLVQVTGLAPEEQRLLFRGKEKDDHEYLHMAGVKDMSKVVLLEDPASRQRKIELMQRNQGIAKACEAVAGVRNEVDKLIEKVNALESSAHSGTKVADQVLVLTELLMRQLLKLDSIEAEAEAKVQRRAEVRRIQRYVEKLDALKLAPKNPNTSSHCSNGTTVTNQWQTFDSGRVNDMSTTAEHIVLPRTRKRAKEPVSHHIEMPSLSHRCVRTRYVDRRAHVSPSPEVRDEPTYTPMKVGLATATKASLSAPRSLFPNVRDKSIYTPKNLGLATVADTSLPNDSVTHHEGSSSVPKGACYESEIYCRRPFAPDSRNKDMQDSCVMVLRGLISRVGPESPSSLTQFTSTANTTLDLLAQLGLDCAELIYWEELCREAEFFIRQLRSLTIIRTKTSLSDLRDTIKRRQDAVDAAHVVVDESTKALRRHQHSSFVVSSEIKDLISRMRGLWKEIGGLMSRRTTLQEERDRQDIAIQRAQQRCQIRHQDMVATEIALTQAVEALRNAKAEYQTLSTIMGQLHDLHARLL